MVSDRELNRVAHDLFPWREYRIVIAVQVIAKRALRQFWDREPRAETPLRTWHALVEKATWRTPNDIKAEFGTSVDFVSDNRVIFDIGGNKYRLIVRVSYEYRRVLIKFVGTHKDYDRIDPETI